MPGADAQLLHAPCAVVPASCNPTPSWAAAALVCGACVWGSGASGLEARLFARSSVLLEVPVVNPARNLPVFHIKDAHQGYLVPRTVLLFESVNALIHHARIAGGLSQGDPIHFDAFARRPDGPGEKLQ